MSAAGSRRRSRSPLPAVLVLAALLLAGCGGGGSDTPTATPVPTPPRAAVIWAVGDGDGDRASRRLVEMMSGEPFDRLLYLGDVYEDGTRVDFDEDYEPTWGRFARRTLPTPGNHDWGNRDEGYFPYWRERSGRPAASWYAETAAGWELLSLNSEDDLSPSSPQLAWLRAQLQEPGDCRIAFMHRPRYSAGDTHGDNASLDPAWDALAGAARIMLGAHEHNMQRFEPIDGMTQFVSGAGGHSRYRVREDARLAFAEDDAEGALRLELEPGRAAWDFVAASGRVLDSGSLVCEPLSR